MSEAKANVVREKALAALGGALLLLALNGNTSEGFQALFSLTTGANNTAIGFDALYSNTSGGVNTANGFQALLHNTTGHDNTVNGAFALLNNTTGSTGAGTVSKL